MYVYTTVYSMYACMHTCFYIYAILMLSYIFYTYIHTYMYAWLCRFLQGNYIIFKRSKDVKIKISHEDRLQ